MIPNGKTFYLLATLAAFGLASLAGSAEALAGGKGSGGSGGGDETRLRAEMIAPVAAGDVGGKADFRDKRGRRKFSVEIEGFAPGEMFDVTVKNEVVGTIEVDGLGVGDFNLDSTAQPDDQADPFPPNFPALDGGEKVEVGPLEGNLQPK